MGEFASALILRVCRTLKIGADQAALDGGARRLRAVGDAELGEDIGEVVLDGLGGNEQLSRNILVARSLRQQLQHLQLALVEICRFCRSGGLSGSQRGKASR